MQTTLAVLALAAAAYAAPQGVTATIAPSAPAPAGCTPSYSGSFNIANINASTSRTKRELAERQLAGTLTLTLSNGVLKDQAGRTGYVAANRQFQFDAPPQTGAIYTSGFSACANSTLALGGSAIWYQCYSGGFYNLYDQAIPGAQQCSQIYFQILPVAGGSSSAAASSAGATVRTDGQPIVSTARTSVVSQLTDGQPRASTAASSARVSQISDGQPQASSARASAISQISDGQPQASSARPAPISQISDGQPQASSARPAPITQISDGQPQAPSATRPAVISQISDGQPQATRPANTTAPRISQISDGQPQATRPANGTVATPTRAAASTSPAAFTGAAQPAAVANFFAIAAGAAAVALL